MTKAKSTPTTYCFLKEGRVERPCRRNGRLSYRWVQGYWLLTDDGNKLYPPMTWREVLTTCRVDKKRRKIITPESA